MTLEAEEDLEEALRSATNYAEDADSVKKESEDESKCAHPGSGNKRARQTSHGDEGFWYGFDAVLFVAWRTAVDDQKSHNVQSLPLHNDPKAADADFMLAMWPDGDSQYIYDLAYAEFRTRSRQANGGKERRELWHQEHVQNHNRIDVRFSQG